MKITTKKIIRELEKKGWVKGEFSTEFIRDVRDIIDEILRVQKNISIKK